jgi:hypothetical protein
MGSWPRPYRMAGNQQAIYVTSGGGGSRVLPFAVWFLLSSGLAARLAGHLEPLLTQAFLIGLGEFLVARIHHRPSVRMLPPCDPLPGRDQAQRRRLALR